MMCMGRRKKPIEFIGKLTHFICKLLCGNVGRIAARHIIVLLLLGLLLNDLMLNLLSLLYLQLLLLMVLIDNMLMMLQGLLILCGNSAWPPDGVLARTPCTSMVL